MSVGVLAPFRGGRWPRSVGSTVLPTPAAPGTPNSPTPANGAQAIYRTLSWVAAGATKFDIYLGTSGTPPLLVPHFVGTSYVAILLPSTTYFWQIVAINDGGSATGPIWSFTTPSAGKAFIALAGSVITNVRAGTITIHQQNGSSPSTGQLIFDTNLPIEGQAVQVGLGGLDSDRLAFGGEIQEQDQTYYEKPQDAVYPNRLIDYTFRLNKRYPVASFANVSATAIAQYLAATYAPGFTSNGVQAFLPTITIMFDGSQPFMTCWQAIATAIRGGVGTCGYNRDLSLTLAAAADTSLDPVDSLHQPLNDTPIAFTNSLAQIRSRVNLTGAATSIPTDLAEGETIVPIADDSLFEATGGNAKTGAQILSYQGLQSTSSVASLAGPGQAPTTAPSVVLSGGTTFPAGTYAWEYTWKTAAGESLPSPSATARLGDLPTPPTPASLANFDPGLIDSGTAWAVGDSVAFLLRYEWSPSGLYNRESDDSGVSGPLVAGAVAGHPTAAAGFKLTFASDSATFPFDSTGVNVIVHVYCSVNGGTYFLHRQYSLSELLFGSTEVLSSSAAFFAHNKGASNKSIRSATVNGIAVGPATVTSRLDYRTKVGGAAPFLLTFTTPNNIDTSFPDTTLDGSLGAAAPSSDTSGLADAVGQVNAGSPSVLMTSAGPFQASGGWAQSGSSVFRYTGITGNTLTGVPTSGPGSLMSTIKYGTQILPVPALTGVNAWNGIAAAISKGAALSLWVQRDDLVAQAALAQLELDENGNRTDGIHEFPITDTTCTSVALCNARGDAELAQFSQPIVSVTYETRDPRTRAGKQVYVNTPDVGPVGFYVIQSVDLTLDSPALPRFSVTASSIKFTLLDLLQRATVTF